MIERGVQSLIRARFADLNEGNLDDFCAESAQAGRKNAGLMWRAANQDTKPG
jgi:hypothetical protein